MSSLHAIVFIDHQAAQVLHFDAEHVQAGKVRAHTHHTAQHGSRVRTEHEFYGHVADALGDSKEVLVVGPGLARTAFKAYCDKHRPEVGRRIVAVEAVDHPSPPQLLALARKYFVAYDRMAGDPAPRSL
jgi:stalled ribosome rescue protein Dom34